MNKTRTALRFIKAERAFALLSSVVVFAVVAYVNHVEALGGQFKLMPVAFVAAATTGAMSIARGWFSREREAKLDAAHSQTYYQAIRVKNALSTIQMVTDMCDHQFDQEHEKCRSAVMRQLQVIKAVYGGGPDPETITGGKKRSQSEMSGTTS